MFVFLWRIPNLATIRCAYKASGVTNFGIRALAICLNFHPGLIASDFGCVDDRNKCFYQAKATRQINSKRRNITQPKNRSGNHFSCKSASATMGSHQTNILSVSSGNNTGLHAAHVATCCTTVQYTCAIILHICLHSITVDKIL